MAFDKDIFFSALGDFGSAATLFGGAAGSASAADASRLSAQGFTGEAQAYDVAAGISLKNVNLSQAATAIQRSQAQRDIFKVIGGAKADIAGAGLEAHGSALDVIRASGQQGALALQLNDTQGQITASGFAQQAASYTGQSRAATAAAAAAEATARGEDAAAAAGKGGGALKTITGIAKIGLGIASLFCWVAREVYGTDNPRWKLFRVWLRAYAPNWLYRIYTAHGQDFAEYIHDKPVWKFAIRMAMEAAIRGWLFRTEHYDRASLFKQWEWELAHA